MREYSPKRRTALVFTGIGASGAYHAGVLKALDESGVKIDLVVGSGVGTIAAAYAAVVGGNKLWGAGGFWEGVDWGRLYRLRPAASIALLLLGASFGVFLLPLVLALVAGLLFPLVLILDLAVPGLPSRIVGDLWAAPALLRDPYLAALAVPVFALCVLAVGFLARAWLRDRRRFAETFEHLIDARPGQDRLRRGLWSVAHGDALARSVPRSAELGARYVSLVSENLGQPGFRELILRTADLDTGAVLPFVLLSDTHRTAFAGTRGPRTREGIPGAVDLRAPGYDALLFEAVATALAPPLAGPVRRVSFPRGAFHPGETHRLVDATTAGGSGLAEALAAGAEQVIVVSAVPESPLPPARRRGLRALLNGVFASLERQALDRDLEAAERDNRMIETLGHRTEDGGRAWQDPVTGRLHRDFALYVVRPERRVLWPLELDGARDPSTDVVETPADLVERGYRDAYRLFVEPVVGAVPMAPRPAEADERQPVRL
jgi:hypothetical protein